MPIGKAEVLRSGSDLLLLCFGPMTAHGIAVAERLSAAGGITATVVNARFAKPLDAELLADLIPRHEFVATIEDHALAGGFSSALLELINDRAIRVRNEVLRFGVNDSFVPHAAQGEQHALHGYDVAGITAELSKRFKKLSLVHAA